MNIYLVVEGEVGEKRVYKSWIPFVNSNLSYVQDISNVDTDKFYIISGNGYPNYLNVIEDAVKDVEENSNFDRLVIAVDSEDMTYTDKYNEINNHIISLDTSIDYRIIVQNFCLETWGLANKAIYTRNTEDDELLMYQSVFNVSIDDPELLPNLEEKNYNRAQFSEKYLRSLLQEKYRGLTYNKRKPDVLMEQTYFEKVKNRYDVDNHISSFSNFLLAFI